MKSRSSAKIDQSANAIWRLDETGKADDSQTTETIPAHERRRQAAVREMRGMSSEGFGVTGDDAGRAVGPMSALMRH